MAVYGVLGDIHGNHHALAATLDLLDERRVERLICVGDIVGYNADPDACAAQMRTRNVFAIAGNHDLISTGRLGFERCSNIAAYALTRTRRALTPSTVRYLDALPARIIIENRVAVVHGGVRDVQQYLINHDLVRHNADYLKSDFPGINICFFGHTHAQKVYEVYGGAVKDLPLTGTVPLRGDRIYFVNPGSVDAARKREQKRAECAVFDSEMLTLEFLSVAYDYAAAEARAQATGYRITPWMKWLYALRRRVTRLAR
jgi:predicted phosphodiesterase